MSAWGAPPPKRCRPRKDLPAPFSKLRRIVSEIKSKRKSLAAHHNVVVELISSRTFTGFPFFPVVPSALSSQNPKASSTLPSHGPQNPQLSASMPLQSPQDPILSTAIPPWQTPQHPRLPATLPLEISQSDTQVPTPAKSIANGIPLELSKFSHMQVHGSIPTGGSSAQLLEADSMEKKAFIAPFSSTFSSTAIHPGKQAARTTFWTVLLLVFLCTFLCTGKEVAVSITIAVYLIIWQTAQPISNPASSYHHKEHHLPASGEYKAMQEHHIPARGEYRAMLIRQIRPLNRSSTILAHHGPSCTSPSAQWTTRSKSLPRLHGSSEEELQFSEPGSSVGSASRVCSEIPSSGCIKAGKFSARLKLQMMLLLVLCGLIHGRIMAVCMASCCIFTFSRLVSRGAGVKSDIMGSIRDHLDTPPFVRPHPNDPRVQYITGRILIP